MLKSDKFICQHDCVGQHHRHLTGRHRRRLHLRLQESGDDDLLRRRQGVCAPESQLDVVNDVDTDGDFVVDDGDHFDDVSGYDLIVRQLKSHELGYLALGFSCAALLFFGTFYRL